MDSTSPNGFAHHERKNNKPLVLSGAQRNRRILLGGFSLTHSIQFCYAKSLRAIGLRKGFSLIEFIIVFALVALLAMLAVPNMSFLQRRMVKADAEQLLSTMLYMQREGMVSNDKKNLKFLVSKNQYTYNNCTVSLSNGVLFGVISGAQGPPSLNIKSPKGAVTYEKQQIQFFPDGKMSPGSVYLTNKTYDVMHAITTAVSHVSYIRMYTYYRGKWERIR